MKDEIINIINLDKIANVRSSFAMQSNIPSKNSLVKLVPLEYLKHGVKVLIDGKLFIAVIDGKIPLKEEIIAVVCNTNPFSLSLNLLPQLKKNEEFLVNSILKKLNLTGNSQIRKFLPQIICEEYYVIKSKILILEELLKNIKAKGLEFSLLVTLLWNNTASSKHMIKDLYDRLFDESFEYVCEQLYQSINGLLFSGLPQYLIQEIADSLIYEEKNKNPQTLLNKSEQIYQLIKSFNENLNVNKNYIENEIDNFTHFGSKYILQKSVLKDYDYYPDFAIAKRDSELILILYNIKKTINEKEEKLYKIVFKNELLPFNLQGIIRENFFDAEIKTSEIDNTLKEVNAFRENLFTRWGFRSEVRINNSKNEEYFISKINSEVNKLIS